MRSCLWLVPAAVSILAACSGADHEPGDPYTRADVPSRKLMCQDALPKWQAVWESKVAETIAASPEDRRAIIADIGKREVSLQTEAFVRLCARRTGNDLGCIVGYPERRGDPTCKEALSAMNLDLGEVLDQGGR